MARFYHLIRNTGIWAPTSAPIFHSSVSLKRWHSEIDWINHYSGGLAFSYFAWKNIPTLARGIGTPTRNGNNHN